MTKKEKINLSLKIIFPTLTLCWLVLIFVFSSQNGNESSSTSGRIVNFVLNLFYPHLSDLPLVRQEELFDIWSMIIRKGAHFTEFGILGVLSFFSFNSFKSSNYNYLFSLLFCFVSAGLDELHQTFIDGRAGMFQDVLIDTSGAIFFLLITFLIIFIVRKVKAKKMNKSN